MIAVLAASAAVICLFMAGMWLLSLRLNDASIVDIGWGLGFVLVAAAAGHFGDGLLVRRLVLLTLVGLWGVRLASHLWLRSRGAGEDFRYRLMRNKHGDRFWIVSLVTVFGLQGLLMWVVSLPVQLAATADDPLGLLAILGVALWAFGLVFETVADNQLRRFRAVPANRRRVLDTGLWRWTRHPNYFGDCCVWWGIWLTTAETTAGLYGIVGPTVMTVLLTRVSGVPMLEHSMAKRRPDYAGYVQRTSSFVPRPPGPRTP